MNRSILETQAVDVLRNETVVELLVDQRVRRGQVERTEFLTKVRSQFSALINISHVNLSITYSPIYAHIESNTPPVRIS